MLSKLQIFKSSKFSLIIFVFISIIFVISLLSMGLLLKVDEALEIEIKIDKNNQLTSVINSDIVYKINSNTSLIIEKENHFFNLEIKRLVDLENGNFKIIFNNKNLDLKLIPNTFYRGKLILQTENLFYSLFS